MVELDKDMCPKCKHCGRQLIASSVAGFSSIYDEGEFKKFGLEVPQKASILTWAWYCEDCDGCTETMMFYLMEDR